MVGRDGVDVKSSEQKAPSEEDGSITIAIAISVAGVQKQRSRRDDLLMCFTSHIALSARPKVARGSRARHPPVLSMRLTGLACTSQATKY